MFVQYDINLISLVILFIVIFSTSKADSIGKMRQRLFRAMVFCAMLLLCFEMAVIVLTSKPGQLINAALYFSFVFILITGVLFCFFWALFCILRQGRRLKPRGYVLLSFPMAAVAILIILNFSDIYLFGISIDNIIYPGKFIYIIGAVSCFYVALGMFIVWRSKKSMPRKEYYLLLILPLIIVAIGILQYMLNIRLVWASAAVGLLVIQLYALGEKMNIDHLTGLYNRKCLDDYVEDLLQSGKSESFAALMLDIDSFKKINDTYGHTEGDKAIMAAASLLKKSVRKGDFLSRYGGDEFLIILDECTIKTTEHVINRLRENVARYNSQNVLPYKLDFSIGYYFFSDVYGLKPKDIFTKIDGLMYKNKQSKISNQEDNATINT